MNIYKFGSYTLSKSERTLYRGEKKVRIDAKSFDILVFFIEHRGELITREMLKREVWKKESLADKTIERAISRVRKTLGDDAVCIKSAPTQGYWWVCPLEEDMEVKQQPGEGGLEILAKELPMDETADILFDFAQRAAGGIIGPHQGAWLDFIERRYQDFGTALDYYGKASPGRELELATYLSPYWSERGIWTDGRERLRVALSRHEEEISDTKARALAWSGYLSYHVSDYRAAKQALSDAVSIAKQIGDDFVLALAFEALGEVAEAEGRFEDAKTILAWSLESSERANTPWIAGRAYRLLGSIAQSEGNYPAAKDFFEQSLVKREEAADKRGMSVCYSRLSGIAIRQNDLIQARSLLDRSRELMSRNRGKQTIAMGYFNEGFIEEAAQQYRPALEAFQKSLELRLEVGERRAAAKSMEAVGKMLARLGDEKEAARILATADALRASTGARLSPAEQNRYADLKLEMRKKYPGEWTEGERQVLEDKIVI